MKVILYMAISINGIIARENNEEDFFSHENWNTTVEFAHKTGCMIWGRKTQEVVEAWGKEYTDEIADVKKIIVSSDSSRDYGENYITATSPKDALEKAAKEGFEEVMLIGGSALNSSFAREGLIDEIILNVEPVVVGQGIPLFSPSDFDLKLKLLGTKNVSDKIIQLHYSVVK